MIEVENTDVNIVRNFIPMRNHMPASAYGLKAISDWLPHTNEFLSCFTEWTQQCRHLPSLKKEAWFTKTRRPQSLFIVSENHKTFSLLLLEPFP